MRLQVLALDYDGTVATHGVLEPSAREAIEAARGAGLAVLLVTGRILADLQRLLGDLRLFDAVVAENGAVIHFPESGRALVLAAAPPESFLAELRRRELPFLAGQSVVELDAAHAHDVLSVVRDLQLPLALLFNRGRLMILPQAVSKATGLREALRALRLSAHNTVGIGDAENDHELLSFCELGIAVAWGSAALREKADEVLPGHGPADVAKYVRALVDEPRIAPGRLGRRKLHLGVREDGRPFALGMRGRNVLVAGDTQSGKSWVAGVLCEQLALEHYCVCVIDPEGEYATLEALPSVVVFDATPHEPDVDDLERTLRYPDVSVVLDLSAMELDAKRSCVRRILERLRDVRRRSGLPHRIVVDEAHYFLQDQTVTDLLDLELGGYTLVTWHASQLHADVLASAEAILVTRVSDPEEARALHALRGGAVPLDAWCERLDGLGRAYAALLPGAEESGEELVRFRVSARLTPHVRHQQKYLSRRTPDDRAFVLRGRSASAGTPIHSLAELMAALSAAPALGEHLRRRDLSRWILDVLDDRVLANRVRAIEERADEGDVAQPHHDLMVAIRERYGAGAAKSPFA